MECQRCTDSIPCYVKFWIDMCPCKECIVNSMCRMDAPDCNTYTTAQKMYSKMLYYKMDILILI